MKTMFFKTEIKLLNLYLNFTKIQFSLGNSNLLRTDEKHCFGNSEKIFRVDFEIFASENFFWKIQNGVFVRSGANSIFQVIFKTWTKLGPFL
jgi:hypothetical protein